MPDFHDLAYDVRRAKDAAEAMDRALTRRCNYLQETLEGLEERIAYLEDTLDKDNTTCNRQR